MKGCVIICTAISLTAKDHYFGRNLDLDHHYNESVVILPRNFPLSFRCRSPINHHYAMIGIATVVEDYPLFYDATNERGLSIAGLNFPGNAKYFPVKQNKENITPFELIPWLLSQCESVEQASHLMQNVNLAGIPFSDMYPLTPLHWIISDKEQSITIESTVDGLRIYQNPVGVLTNNPSFPFHMDNLSNYLNLTCEIPENRFSRELELIPYSLGMGAIGLPGDLSSASRFIRAAFTKLNSVANNNEDACVSQFFHILESVAQSRGCCRTENGFEQTLYSSCCNANKGIYYYTTYENHQISAVNMFHQDLTGTLLYCFPLIRKQNIQYLN